MFRLPRLISDEVRRNLSAEEYKDFLIFVTSLTVIDEDFVVPFEIGFKYGTQGLKPADSFIAAYAEWVGADALVTENRHFLKRTDNLPFVVVTAEECLRLMNLPRG
jgi:predicted nucleic acid-binding protein